MYTLKSIAQRSTVLSMAAALVVATIMPAASAFAQQALNPLTERSLLLSSSAPGFQDTDGSGYSTTAGNPAVGVNGTPATYAPAGSGPNGKKTGQTFTFKTSSSETIQGFSLQYCMTAAGHCQSPGNNTGDADPDDDGSFTGSTREDNATAHPLGRSDLEVVDEFVNSGAGVTTPGAGEFVVVAGGTALTGWTMEILNAESEDTSLPGGDVDLTGKNNMIHLYHATGQSMPAGTQVKIMFVPSESIYITNPGDRAFFVKINSYDTDDTEEFIPDSPAAENTHIVDGGVTVANVMTDSIHITTKVLETMAFSVGTRNRDTLTLNCVGYPTPQLIAQGCEAVSGAVHGTCSPIQQVNNNRLQLGDANAEYSLKTDTAYDVYSYWRLSSNSSGGATVYYSGNTLANTVGDEITDMQTEALSTRGTEQFGLGFVDASVLEDGTTDARSAEYISQQPGRQITNKPFKTLSGNIGLNAAAGYTDAAQTISTGYDEAAGSINSSATAKFQFHKSSSSVPVAIAQQNERVISCSTAKMRYVANIAADTPAGVYTTKINYLAAPQY